MLDPVAHHAGCLRRVAVQFKVGNRLTRLHNPAEKRFDDVGHPRHDVPYRAADVIGCGNAVYFRQLFVDPNVAE